MPTYEYRCIECGHIFEIVQKIIDEPLKQCPKCKGKLTKTIPKNFNFILKGKFH